MAGMGDGGSGRSRVGPVPRGVGVVVGALMLVLWWAPQADAHRGPLDDRGCHRHTQAGWYVCHEGALKGRRFANHSGAKRALAKLRATEALRSLVAPAPVLDTSVPSVGPGLPPLSHPSGYGPYAAQGVRVLAGGVLALEVSLWPGLTQRTVLRLAGVHLPAALSADSCEAKAAKAVGGFMQDWIGSGPLEVREVVAARDGNGVSGQLWKDGARLSQALIDAGLGSATTGASPTQWCR